MSTSTARRLIGTAGAIAAGVMFAAVPLLTASPAYAYVNDWHGHYRPGPPPHAYYHGGGYRPGAGVVVGGALLGLGVGAAIGALAAPPVVYAPPQAYYPPAPPPVYYGY